MPIYEYHCQDCGATFDALRSMREADLPILCQACQGVHTTRQLSVFFAPASGGGASGNPYIDGNHGSSCSGCSGGSCASCHH